jgi:peptidoglycan/xylan/chitin deacetylase (PgdA/CDA1 family)
VRGSVILGYHRVLASPRVDPLDRRLQVSDSQFQQHMQILARRFSIVPLQELVTRLTAGEKTDGVAAVTFDDGYADNYLCAFPILSRMGIPATIFLATDYIEHARPFWMDRLAWYLCRTAGAVLTLPAELGGGIDLTSSERVRQAYLDLRAKLQVLEDGCRREHLLNLLGAADPPDSRPLAWDEILRMHRQGMGFGAHTRTHPSLTALSDAWLRQEIEASRDLITTRLGTKPALFAYPFSHVDGRVSRMVETAGFCGAVTSRAGVCLSGSQRFLLPRLEVGSCTALTRELDMLGGGVRSMVARARPLVLRLRSAIPRPVARVIKSIRRARERHH